MGQRDAVGDAPATRADEPEAILSGQSQTRRLTILYTGYGRGNVVPIEDRPCPT